MKKMRTLLKSRYTYELLFGFCLLMLVISRIHTVFLNQELNVDETMLLSQAITLSKTGGYFWEKLHGGSVGLINTYLVLLFSKIGLPIDFSTAHFISLLLVVSTCLLLFLVGKKRYSSRVAFWGVFPTLFFLIIAQKPDFLHLSSEQLPVFFIALVTYWVALGLSSNSNTYWYISGFLLGVVPYTKLQSSLLAVFVALVIAYILIEQKKIKVLGVYIFTGFLFSIINALILIRLSAFDKFYDRYIVDNLSYINTDSLSVKVGYFFDKIISEKSLLLFLLVFLVIFIIGAVKERKSILKEKKTLAILLFLFFITIYSIIKPGNFALHYYYFLIFPITLGTLFIASKVKLSDKHAAFTFVPLLLLVFYFIIKRKQFVPDFTKAKLVETQAGKIARKYLLKDSDTLVEYIRYGHQNVLLQRPQGTSMNFDHRNYRNRAKHLLKNFQNEIVEHQPLVIFEHSLFPELKNEMPTLYQFVKTNYIRIGEFNVEKFDDGIQQTEIVYIRKDRYEATNKLKNDITK